MNLPKSLEKFADRIADLSDEREYGDGYFLVLRGYREPDNICHTLHRDTITELLADVRRSVKCDCAECKLYWDKK